MATLCDSLKPKNYCRVRGVAMCGIVLLVSTAAQHAQAQTSPTVIKACYVPKTGTVYRVGQSPDLPQACTSDKHVPFEWVDAAGADHSRLTGLGNDDHPQYLRNEAAAGGDLGGTYPSPTVVKLLGRTVGGSNPANGQVLGWNSAVSQWEPTSLPTGVTVHSQLSELGNDDHPQYLLSNGVRTSPNGFASTGTLGSGTLLSQGPGTRLVWYPGKAAFRAGYAENQWNDGGIGTYSVAMGTGTIASGLGAVALGGFNQATNIWSTAFGRETSAIGIVSTALGRNTIASGNSATSSGYLTRATGDYSTALGWLTTAQAVGSTAIGRLNVVAGSLTQWISTDPLFVVGNGASESERSNALLLTKDGNLTIAGTLTQSSDIRLKEDVEPLGAVLDRVRRLAPIRYRFREGTGHPLEQKLGLSAQVVEAVFPELVRRGPDGYLSVAYGDLSAVLAGAIHEQQSMIDSLRSSNAALAEEHRATGHEIGRLRGELTRLETARDELAARLSQIERVLLSNVRGGGR